MYGFVFGLTLPLTTSMISEITPLKWRGRFILIVNFYVSIGKLVAFILACIFLESFTEGNWRGMMITSSFIPLATSILIFLYIKDSFRF